MFPSIAFVHYPAISRIIRDECEKRGIDYIHYNTLPEILKRFSDYMRDVGNAPTMPMTRSVPADAVLARI